MNTKRRADLQRKLSMGAVPRPPDDLAERIKSDIPTYLRPVASSPRFSWSSAFTMRVAASLILVITSVVFTLNVLDRRTETKAVASRAKAPAPAADRQTPHASDTTTTFAATEEVTLQITEQAAPAAAPQRADAVEREEDVPEAPAEARRELASADLRAEIGGVTGGVADAVVATAEAPVAAAAPAATAVPQQVAEFAPEPAPVPPPPPPAAAPSLAQERAAKSAAEAVAPTARAANSGVVSQAYADSLRLQPPTELFGISIDPAVFHGIKGTIEHGARPSPASVDVDALVNYFAGAPARAPRREVALEVEAAPAPVSSDANRTILRFSVDTPPAPGTAAGSKPPAAIEARLEIDINSNSVARFRRVGGTGALSTEAILLHGMSVTGLYELELKPGLSRAARIATVRLVYRSVSDGRERSVQRVIHRHDLARSWAGASRRHRLASLGAVWGENLRGKNGGQEIARRAEELAKQEPGDARARELADAARETTGGGT